MEKLKSNPVIYLLLNLLLYTFYGLLLGLAFVPAALFVRACFLLRPFGSTIANISLTAISCGMGGLIFVLAGLVVCSLGERILSRGITPGRYSVSSPVFLRWLVLSGIHTIALSLFLPLVQGSEFIRLYFRTVGCRMGKDTFINTSGLHDCYLLTLGDGVVLGGKSDITCHLFEGEYLILGEINIGDRVIIGANCYIMPGVIIKSECSIGAGSIIRKNRKIPARSVITPLPSLSLKQSARLMRSANSAGTKPERQSPAEGSSET